MARDTDKARIGLLTLGAAASFALAACCAVATVHAVFFTDDEWTILAPVLALCAVLASWMFVSALRGVRKTATHTGARMST